MDVILHYKPHDGQKKLHQSTAQYRTALCGRRFGKSLAAVYEIIKRINVPGIKMCWMSPSYSTSSVGVEALAHICRDAPEFCKITGNSPKIAKFCNGVQVPFFSLDRPEHIRGKGFDFIVTDESQLIKDDIFNDIISPTLAQSQHPEILTIGTPRSKTTWFHKNFERGSNDNYPKYESFHFPSSANPYLSLEYLEDQKAVLPSNVYQREYLAQYPEEDASVFPKLYKCVNTGDPTCEHKHRSIGVDLAKTTDYTVFTSICKDCGRIVDFDRFNQLDYSTVVKKLAQFQLRNVIIPNEFPPIYFDNTGCGIVVADMIDEAGIKNAIPYTFTNKSKEKLVNDLIATMDRDKLSIPEELSDLIFELEIFAYVISPSGNFIYNAPSGMHDDTVYSLCLAVQGMVSNIVTPWVYNSDDDISSEQNINQQLINFINDDGSDGGFF